MSYLLLDLFNSILVNNLQLNNEIIDFFYSINENFSKENMFNLIDLLSKNNIDLKYKFTRYEELYDYYEKKIHHL